MVWPRKPGRNAGGRRRPRLEALEQRQLLTVSVGPDAAPALVAPVLAGVTVPGAATDFDKIIGASAARAQYKVDGTGSAVATIDTGVDYNNVDFGGGGFGPGHKVVAGFDFADGTADPIAINQHGTAVAGLIAGNDPGDPGVAPGADIVALRVFNNAGTSSFANIDAALKWVIDNHSTYHITVVNMSISDGNNYTSNWFAQDGGVGSRITDKINQLAALDIPVVAAAGNSFSGQQGMGFTAVVPSTISVTSTDAGGQIVSNAQRLGAGLGGDSATDAAAPGSGLYAPAGDGGTFTFVDGTSFAAPLVSGSLVLLQQIYSQRFGTLPSVAQLDRWIKNGSDPIHDATTGLTIGGLDIPKAAALVPSPVSNNPPPPQPTPPPDVNGGGATAPTPPPVTTPAGTTTGGSTSDAGAVKTEVYLNGQDLGGISSTQADGGWSAFLSLFSGGITSIQTWNNGGTPAATTPIPFAGATLTSIQQWSAAPTPVPASSAAPDAGLQPTGVPQDVPAQAQVTVVPQAQGTVRIPRLKAQLGTHHPSPHATPHMTRAWDAGFAGHRRHR